jgi:spore coat polysaccharide biosynthesis protein SpsF
MKIGATIQARMGSTRLPGKVLKEIVGKPMLALQIERLQQCRLIDEIILATSVAKQDDVLADLVGRLGIGCFRGSEEDVVSRVVGALRAFQVDIHVEFMGDNPLPDPLLVDAIIGYYLKHQNDYDYVTNSLKTTYPPGAEVSFTPRQSCMTPKARSKRPGSGNTWAFTFISIRSVIVFATWRRPLGISFPIFTWRWIRRKTLT